MNNNSNSKPVDEVTGEIVAASIKLHTGLGPGLLESVCETPLAKALEARGLSVRRQAAIAFEFDGLRFDEGLRIDLLVNDTVIVELKSVEKLAPIHSKQVLTYLRLLRLEVGLLINFGAMTLLGGLHRIVNNYPDKRTTALSAPGNTKWRS